MCTVLYLLLNVFKERIVQAYDMLPEAYRQKFRNLVKQGGKTHVEFAREKKECV